MGFHGFASGSGRTAAGVRRAEVFRTLDDTKSLNFSLIKKNIKYHLFGCSKLLWNVVVSNLRGIRVDCANLNLKWVKTKLYGPLQSMIPLVVTRFFMCKPALLNNLEQNNIKRN